MILVLKQLIKLPALLLRLINRKGRLLVPNKAAQQSHSREYTRDRMLVGADPVLIAAPFWEFLGSLFQGQVSVHSSYFVPFECPLVILLNCILREKPHVLCNSGIITSGGRRRKWPQDAWMLRCGLFG